MFISNRKIRGQLRLLITGQLFPVSAEEERQGQRASVMHSPDISINETINSNIQKKIPLKKSPAAAVVQTSGVSQGWLRPPGTA